MNQSTGQIAIYQTDDGQVQLEVAEKNNMQKMHIAYFNYPAFPVGCQKR